MTISKQIRIIFKIMNALTILLNKFNNNTTLPDNVIGYTKIITYDNHVKPNIFYTDIMNKCLRCNKHVEINDISLISYIDMNEFYLYNVHSVTVDLYCINDLDMFRISNVTNLYLRSISNNIRIIDLSFISNVICNGTIVIPRNVNTIICKKTDKLNIELPYIRNVILHSCSSISKISSIRLENIKCIGVRNHTIYLRNHPNIMAVMCRNVFIYKYGELLTYENKTKRNMELLQ